LNPFPAVSQLGSLLVVDDEPEIGDVVRDFFEGLGYSVNCALNGRDALVLASLSRPDAVILDIRMPGRNGDDVLRDLLTLDDSIAVVMLSGNDQEHLARELLRTGAFDYVRKPFSLDNLQSVVELAMLVGKRKVLPDDATPWQCEPRSFAQAGPLTQADARCGGCGERVGEADTTAVRERRGLFHAGCWLSRVGLEGRPASAVTVSPLLDSSAAS
jgi:CheY-like chemotaxis protein